VGESGVMRLTRLKEIGGEYAPVLRRDLAVDASGGFCPSGVTTDADPAAKVRRVVPADETSLFGTCEMATFTLPPVRECGACSDVGCAHEAVGPMELSEDLFRCAVIDDDHPFETVSLRKRTVEGWGLAAATLEAEATDATSLRNAAMEEAHAAGRAEMKTKAEQTQARVDLLYETLWNDNFPDLAARIAAVLDEGGHENAQALLRHLKRPQCCADAYSLGLDHGRAATSTEAKMVALAVKHFGIGEADVTEDHINTLKEIQSDLGPGPSAAERDALRDERDEFKRLLERFAECGVDGGWRLREAYLARGKLKRICDMLDPAVIARAAEAVQAIERECERHGAQQEYGLMHIRDLKGLLAAVEAAKEAGADE